MSRCRLASAWLLRLRAHPLLVPGAVAAVVGAALAMTQGQPLAWQSFLSHVTENGLPYLLALMDGVCWALFSALSRVWTGGEQDGAIPVFMCVTGVVLGVTRFAFAEHSVWTGRATFEMMFMIMMSYVAYGMWDHAMRKGEIILVTTCSYFIPLLSTIFSSLYLGTAAGVKLWIGCALVIAGAIVCKLSANGPLSRRLKAAG